MPYKAGQGFLISARNVLMRSKTPMTCRGIVERATSAGLLISRGMTPEKTLFALLSRDIRDNENRSEFRKVGPGLFTLAKRS